MRTLWHILVLAVKRMLAKRGTITACWAMAWLMPGIGHLNSDAICIGLLDFYITVLS